MVKLDVPSPVLHWILGSTYKNISVQMWIFHLVPSNNFFKLIPIHAGMVGMLANTAFLCRSGHLIQFAANIFFINWSLPPVPWQVMGWQKWLFCEDLGIWFKSWQKHFLLKLTAPHHHEVYEKFLARNWMKCPDLQWKVILPALLPLLGKTWLFYADIDI